MAGRLSVRACQTPEKTSKVSPQYGNLYFCCIIVGKGLGPRIVPSNQCGTPFRPALKDTAVQGLGLAGAAVT